MNTPPDIVHESAGVSDPGYSAKTRPFYWSVKRELWENRSIYIAPLIVAVVVLLFKFAIIVPTQVLMMLWTSVLLIAHGMSPASTWTNFSLFQQSLILLYGLVAIALWHAPIYGWALLVSGWARRATFLWAVVPFLAI